MSLFFWLVGFRIPVVFVFFFFVFEIMGKSSAIHLILPTSYVCVSTINERVPEERSHLLQYHRPRTVILVSGRHGDVFWQRFSDVFFFFSLFLFLFKTTTDIFPSGRLALHGHVSTTSAPVDSGGGEGREGGGGGTWPFLSDLCQHSCVSLM